MRTWLVVITEAVVPAIDGIALLVIVIGTIEAFITAVGIRISTSNVRELRAAWLRYARWLVAGLTFQLAADIIETSIAPTWDAVGRLAAIAAIRTALDFFLERDVAEMNMRQQERAPTAPSSLRAVDP